MSISKEIREIVNTAWKSKAEYAIRHGRILTADEECDIIIEAYEAAKTSEQPDELTIADYEASFADHRRLVRELDVALNGEEGAAQQASLCDIVAQVKTIKRGVTPSEAEDVLERCYWEFDDRRKKTGEERLSFKSKMRWFASYMTNTTPKREVSNSWKSVAVDGYPPTGEYVTWDGINIETHDFVERNEGCVWQGRYCMDNYSKGNEHITHYRAFDPPLSEAESELPGDPK